MSTSEAAEALGVEERTVRLMAADGKLEAVKRGNAWWLDRRDVERRRRRGVAPGRPLSPSMAWSVILLASGHERPIGAKHHLARARRWLASHSLAQDASQLRARAARETFDVHPSELPRVAARDDVMRTGISAADVVGIHGGRESLELYAPAGQRNEIVDGHAMEPGDGPVLMRWVSDEIWPSIQQASAPRAAIWLDLLDHDDPRARREAERALR